MKKKVFIVLGALVCTLVGLIQPLSAKADSTNTMVALPTPIPVVQKVKEAEDVAETKVMREDYSDGSWSVQYRGKSAEEVIQELGLEDEVTFISSYTQTAEAAR